VARDGAVATLSPAARAAMQRSADLIEGFVSGEQPVYGVTTGFGSLATASVE
jgi:histidine ammonia-lyase